MDGNATKILKSGYMYGCVKNLSEQSKIEDMFDVIWTYLVDFDRNRFRTFYWGREMPEWRHRLDRLPRRVFTWRSIEVFHERELERYEHDMIKNAFEQEKL